MSRVLVVDDDELIRQLIQFKLGQAGFEVVCAEDGEEGLAAAVEGDFDAVVLDQMMPRLSGIEVCRGMRRHPATRDLPVILLTQRSQEADIEQGFAAGADDYVLKPFSPRELVSRVEALIGPATASPALGVLSARDVVVEAGPGDAVRDIATATAAQAAAVLDTAIGRIRSERGRGDASEALAAWAEQVHGSWVDAMCRIADALDAAWSATDGERSGPPR